MDQTTGTAAISDEDRIIGSTGEAADSLKSAIDRRWKRMREDGHR